MSGQKRFLEFIGRNWVKFNYPPHYNLPKSFVNLDQVAFIDFNRKKRHLYFYCAGYDQQFGLNDIDKNDMPEFEESYKQLSLHLSSINNTLPQQLSNPINPSDTINPSDPINPSVPPQKKDSNIDDSQKEIKYPKSNPFATVFSDKIVKK